MFEEEGLVKEVIGNKALVLVEGGRACSHCSERHSCQVIEESERRLAQVLNPIGAWVGDRVRIEMKEGLLLKNALIIYLIPSLCLVVGAVFGGHLGKYYGWNTDFSAILMGLLILGVSFFCVYLFGRHPKRKKQYMPCIQKIIIKHDQDISSHQSVPDLEV